jgi:hypothetical protein
LCAKKYFGELEDSRLLTKIFHSRPPSSNCQGTPALPMPMGYEQFQPPSSNLNANNSKKIKIENDHSQNILIIKQFGLEYILKKSSKVFKREYFILVSGTSL